MRVFLTGGTGFIGGPLTRSLVARGWNVTALVRKPDSPRTRTLETLGAQCVAGDITDRESMRPGMTGADIVVHGAAWYEMGIHPDARPLMRAINVTGTDHVLGLALELGIRRTVYVSSAVYYGDTGPDACDETCRPNKPYRFYYVQTKAEAHDVALDYQQRGLPLVIVCPSNVFGPNDHSIFGYFLRLYLNRLMVPFGFSPEMILSPAHVDDIGDGIALAVAKGRTGETYILAGDPISLRKIFETWHTMPGGLKVRFYIPRGLAKILFASLEPLQRLVGLPAFLSRETVEGSAISYYFSSAKAQRELGWTYRPTREMWQDIVDRELALLAGRKKRGLVSRLRPVETSG